MATGWGEELLARAARCDIGRTGPAGATCPHGIDCTGPGGATFTHGPPAGDVESTDRDYSESLVRT